FIGDGIDILASDVTVANNKIHDIILPKSGIHTDGIHGQLGRVPAGASYVTYDNILIDSNWVQALADSWLKDNPSLINYLQGILGTDGDWSHVTITNNVVITHACHGINWASTHDSLVANNTVVWDGLPSANCFPQIASGGGTHQSIAGPHNQEPHKPMKACRAPTRRRSTICPRLCIFALIPGLGIAMCVSASRARAACSLT